MEDELVGILGKLVEFVENASPVIWEVAQRQVVANIASGMVWSVFLIVLTIASIKFGKLTWVAAKGKGEYDEVWWYSASVLSYVSSIICFTIAVTLITWVIKMAINPVYYAIENILSMVR